jgi:hypothetical protein
MMPPTISEKEWLSVGLGWMFLGFFAALPLTANSWLGHVSRWILLIAVPLHFGEALLGALLAKLAGLGVHEWFGKALLLGFVAWTKLLSADGHAGQAAKQVRQ